MAMSYYTTSRTIHD